MSGQQWFYQDASGQEAGPVSGGELKKLGISGVITSETLVWREGLEQWVAARRIKGLIPERPAAASTPSARQGASVPSSAPARRQSRYAQPAGAADDAATATDQALPGQGSSESPWGDDSYGVAQEAPAYAAPVSHSPATRVSPGRRAAGPAQQLGYATPTGLGPRQSNFSGHVQYAGIWPRFCAAFLDGIILRFISFGLGFVLGMILGITDSVGASESARIGLLMTASVVDIVVYWLYFSLQECSEARATIGKRAMGLSVSDLNGAQLSFGRATGRYFGKLLSTLTVMVGYLMAGFTEKKQALHDLMAGTVVTKR